MSICELSQSSNEETSYEAGNKIIVNSVAEFNESLGLHKVSEVEFGPDFPVLEDDTLHLVAVSWGSSLIKLSNADNGLSTINEVTGEGLAHLSTWCRNLRSLELMGCPLLDDSAIIALGDLPDLQDLTIGSMEIAGCSPPITEVFFLHCATHPEAFPALHNLELITQGKAFLSGSEKLEEIANRSEVARRVFDRLNQKKEFTEVDEKGLSFYTNGNQENQAPPAAHKSKDFGLATRSKAAAILRLETQERFEEYILQIQGLNPRATPFVPKMSGVVE